MFVEDIYMSLIGSLLIFLFVSSPFNVSQEQKWQIQEQQLKLQISQLETALQTDLDVKKEILYKIKTEEGSSAAFHQKFLIKILTLYLWL